MCVCVSLSLPSFLSLSLLPYLPSSLSTWQQRAFLMSSWPKMEGAIERPPSPPRRVNLCLSLSLSLSLSLATWQQRAFLTSWPKIEGSLSLALSLPLGRFGQSLEAVQDLLRECRSCAAIGCQSDLAAEGRLDVVVAEDGGRDRTPHLREEVRVGRHLLAVQG